MRNQKVNPCPICHRAFDSAADLDWCVHSPRRLIWLHCPTFLCEFQTNGVPDPDANEAIGTDEDHNNAEDAAVEEWNRMAKGAD